MYQKKNEEQIYNTTVVDTYIRTYIHSFSILSDDRSKASSKTMPPYSAI